MPMAVRCRCEGHIRYAVFYDARFPRAEDSTKNILPTTNKSKSNQQAGEPLLSFGSILVSCELGLKETTGPTGGTQKGECRGGPTNGQAAACRRRLQRLEEVPTRPKGRWLAPSVHHIAAISSSDFST